MLVSFATVALALLPAPLNGWAAEDEVRPGEFIPAAPAQPAPQVAFTDLAGKAASLDDFKGRPVVLNLWATWCRPCLEEMPSLDRLEGMLAGKLVVAAVSEDRSGGDRVEPFVAKLNLKDLKVYLDPDSAVARAFHARGLPTSIVLDAEGRIVGRVEGAAEWDSDKMLAVLKPLLADSEALKKAAR